MLRDRGFRSVDLFKFIDETLKLKYCIRCTKDIGIAMKDNPKIKKLEDINHLNNNRAKYFYNIKLTAEAYMCNMAVCKDQDADYVWYIANNLGESTAIREDKKNKIIGAVKNLNGKRVRIYSLFRSGLKWFNRCYYSLSNEYYLKIAFILYEG